MPIEDLGAMGLFVSGDDARACSFERWYDSFRSNGKSTFRSVVVPLTQDFVEYLHEDGIRLPAAPAGAESLRARDPRSIKAKQNDADSDWGSDSEEEEESIPRVFGELESRIQSAVEDLGGEVFAKLNWTSPRDAAYICGGSLSCATPGEVFLLLKASDICQSDLKMLERTHTDPMLVLRKHLELNPAMEFRCFVRESRVLFVCQRDTSRFFEYLLNRDMQRRILTQVSTFISETILPRFSLKNFIADVYVETTARKPQGKVWLVDLAPLARYMHGANEDIVSEDMTSIAPHALISWDEIYTRDLSAKPEFKVVQGESSVDNSEHKVLAMNKVPLDLVNGSLTTDTMEEAFQRFRSSSIGD